jgi:hypothetical protein
LLLALPAMCGAAYLPRLGPTPLRYLPSPPATHQAFPPLPMPDDPPPSAQVADSTPPAISASPQKSAPTNAVAESVALLPPAISPPELAAVTQGTNQPGPAVVPPEPLLTPQMLLQCFYERFGATNGSRAVLGPLLFVPPNPTPKSGSKATLTTPDAR